MANSADLEAPLGVLLITANVGSLFEQPAALQGPWLEELYKLVEEKRPDFLAIHCQEVGGKSYESGMKDVDDFIERLLAAEQMQEFNCCRAYLDEDFNTKAEFTALGSIFFVHKNVKDVTMWNFSGSRFHPVAGKEVCVIKCNNLHEDPYHEKMKFPPNFFPQFPWSRKGFIRTRWCMRNKVFDMVNVHLFHDACNLEAGSQSPSIYVANRNRALKHTLSKLSSGGLQEVPTFIFGDFNFRLNLHGVLEKFFGEPQHTRKPDGSLSRAEYHKDNLDEPYLAMERKLFKVHKSFVVQDHADELRKFDFEKDSFPELCEQPVTFAPSYPFSEDKDCVRDYMATRCPSWCDRVLYNDLGQTVINQARPSSVSYGLMGEDSCMGDHKPVALHFEWPAEVRTVTPPPRSESSVKTPQVDKSLLVAMVIAVVMVLFLHTGLGIEWQTAAIIVVAFAAGLLLLLQKRPSRS